MERRVKSKQTMVGMVDGDVPLMHWTVREHSISKIKAQGKEHHKHERMKAGYRLVALTNNRCLRRFPVTSVPQPFLKI